jgi:hypothetical protein
MLRCKNELLSLINLRTRKMPRLCRLAKVNQRSKAGSSETAYMFIFIQPYEQLVNGYQSRNMLKLFLHGMGFSHFFN